MNEMVLIIIANIKKIGRYRVERISKGYFYAVMQYQFRIIPKNQCLHLERLCITIVITAILFGCAFGLTQFLSSLFLYVFIGVSITAILPVAVLHIQYYFTNRNSVLLLDTLNKTINYLDQSTEIKQGFDDIQAFDSYKNYAAENGMYSWGQYKYYKIMFKNGQAIVITSLMLDYTSNILEEALQLQPEKHKHFLAVNITCLIAWTQAAIVNPVKNYEANKSMVENKLSFINLRLLFQDINICARAIFSLPQHLQ